MFSLRTAGVIAISLALALSCKRSGTPQQQRGLRDSTRESRTPTSVPSQLRDGDLIFQESTSSQSEMVRVLTNSRWTHMGVVLNEPAGPVVFEAVSPVRKTPLRKWIGRGREQHYVVKRLRDADARLSPEVTAKMHKIAATWLGRPYDLRFRWDDQALYCSELAYKLFDRAAGVQLGKLERAADMHLDDEAVQRALRKRFATAKFDPTETVVTPDSIFNDDQLLEVEL